MRRGSGNGRVGVLVSKDLLRTADLCLVAVLTLFFLAAFLAPSRQLSDMDEIITSSEKTLSASKEEVSSVKKVPSAETTTANLSGLPQKTINGTIKRERPAYSRETKGIGAAGSISRIRDAGKRLSITFDGGSTDSSAEEILDILLGKGLQATFFLTGRFIEKHPDLTKRISREGHEVGNHTYSHPHLAEFRKGKEMKTLPGIGSAFLAKELYDTARLFREATGKEMVPFWRAPYGEINRDILTWASSAGYRHIGWTIDYKTRTSMDSLDWVADKGSSFYLTAEEIKVRLLAFADDKGRAEGGIILMHLGTERTEEVAHEKLGEIIDGFQARGYELVPLSNLIENRKTG